MRRVVRKLLGLAAVLFLISGCYSTPVRHLASDVGLIKVGESNREDVLTYLGDPDEQATLDDGRVKWVFREYESSALKNAPMVGKYFGPKNYGTITVILKNNVVSECIYGAYDDDELDWADDFGWQDSGK